MRHAKKRKIGKGMDQRRKLLRSLASSLFLYEKISTSLKNARATKSYAEKLITRSKEATLHNRRILISKLTPIAAKKAVEVLGPKYKERKGGYTRMIKLQHHLTGKSKVLLELVE